MEIRKVQSHYEIYVNDMFYCSCDTIREAEEEMKYIDL